MNYLCYFLSLVVISGNLKGISISLEVIAGKLTGWFLDSASLVKGSKEGKEKRNIEKIVREGVFLGQQTISRIVGPYF